MPRTLTLPSQAPSLDVEEEEDVEVEEEEEEAEAEAEEGELPLPQCWALQGWEIRAGTRLPTVSKPRKDISNLQPESWAS
jgi:hypothetical protein